MSHSKIFFPDRGRQGRVAFVETRNDAALDPRKVALDAIDQKTLSLEDGASNRGLPRSDFDREDAAVRQQRRQILGNPHVGSKTFFPAVEGASRVVAADFWRQTGELV